MSRRMNMMKKKNIRTTLPCLQEGKTFVDLLAPLGVSASGHQEGDHPPASSVFYLTVFNSTLKYIYHAHTTPKGF